MAALLPHPSRESDKYRRGVVGIAAGSTRYPGAAVLAVAGALRGGAGAVRYVGAATGAVLARFPETLVSDTGPKKAGRVQAWVAGPGAGDDPAPVAEALSTDVPVLLDADGLRLADRETVRTRPAPTLLTPHAGEAAALLGISREEVEASRLTAVRALARAYDATVLLKGSTTLIAAPDPDTPVRVNATGTPWLATMRQRRRPLGSGGLAPGGKPLPWTRRAWRRTCTAWRAATPPTAPRRAPTTWRRRSRRPGGTSRPDAHPALATQLPSSIRSIASRTIPRYSTSSHRGLLPIRYMSIASERHSPRSSSGRSTESSLHTRPASSASPRVDPLRTAPRNRKRTSKVIQIPQLPLADREAAPSRPPGR